MPEQSARCRAPHEIGISAAIDLPARYDSPSSFGTELDERVSR